MRIQGLFGRTFLAAALMISGIAVAGEPVDASAFDISGVRLGMSPDQVADALIAHFHAKRTSLTITKQVPLALHKEAVTDIAFEKNPGERVSVHFETKNPIDVKSPMAADMISYNVPLTSENRTGMHDAAIKKYGPPAVHSAAGDGWCLDSTIMACKTNQARLTLEGTALRLFDDRYLDRRNRLLEQQANRTPSL